MGLIGLEIRGLRKKLTEKEILLECLPEYVLRSCQVFAKETKDKATYHKELTGYSYFDG